MYAENIPLFPAYRDSNARKCEIDVNIVVNYEEGGEYRYARTWDSGTTEELPNIS